MHSGLSSAADPSTWVWFRGPGVAGLGLAASSPSRACASPCTPGGLPMPRIDQSWRCRRRNTGCVAGSRLVRRRGSSRSPPAPAACWRRSERHHLRVADRARRHRCPVRCNRTSSARPLIVGGVHKHLGARPRPRPAVGRSTAATLTSTSSALGQGRDRLGFVAIWLASYVLSSPTPLARSSGNRSARNLSASASPSHCLASRARSVANAPGSSPLNRRDAAGIDLPGDRSFHLHAAHVARLRRRPRRWSRSCRLHCA